MPFAPIKQIRSIADIRELEKTPLNEAVTVASTYEIFVESARAFGNKTALTFLRSGNPDDAPIRLSYQQLLQGINQTANLFHTMGIGAEDAVAALLPGCLEYHLVLWGGEAAGIVQPLNPLLAIDKLAELIEAAGTKILIAYGGPEDANYWENAMALRARIAG